MRSCRADSRDLWPPDSHSLLQLYTSGIGLAFDGAGRRDSSIKEWHESMDKDSPRSTGSSVTAVRIEIPASDEFIELLRGTAGRVARIAGMTYDGIEDFALAVDEAAVLLLDSRPADLAMVISVDSTDGLVAGLTAISASEVWPAEGLEADTRWKVIDAMCERVWLLDGDDVGIGLAQSIR